MVGQWPQLKDSVEAMVVLKSNDEKEPRGSLKQFTRQGVYKGLEV